MRRRNQKQRKPPTLAQRIEATNKQIARCHRERRKAGVATLHAERIKQLNIDLRRFRNER